MAMLKVSDDSKAKSSLAVIFRSRDDSAIGLSGVLQEKKRGWISQVILVSLSHEERVNETDGVIHVHSPVGRFGALALGLRYANTDRVLFLDQDQSISDHLGEELANMTADSIFIPERSANRNIIGRLLDMKRIGLEQTAAGTCEPAIPVIPRCYRTSLALRAIDNMDPSEIRTVAQHEDSLLFYEVSRLSKNSGWASGLILNEDPTIFRFIYKSFQYGRNAGIITQPTVLTTDHRNLLFSLDRGRFHNFGRDGLYRGMAVDMLKGPPYLLGQLVGRHSRISS